MADFNFDPNRTILGSVFTHAGEEELSLSELGVEGSAPTA
jgi:hypothetical protein